MIESSIEEIHGTPYSLLRKAIIIAAKSAYKAHKGMYNFSDYMEMGLVILAECADKYDPNKDVKFYTYFSKCLRIRLRGDSYREFNPHYSRTKKRFNYLIFTKDFTNPKITNILDNEIYSKIRDTRDVSDELGLIYSIITTKLNSLEQEVVLSDEHELDYLVKKYNIGKQTIWYHKRRAKAKVVKYYRRYTNVSQV